MPGGFPSSSNHSAWVLKWLFLQGSWQAWVVAAADSSRGGTCCSFSSHTCRGVRTVSPTVALGLRYWDCQHLRLGSSLGFYQPLGPEVSCPQLYPVFTSPLLHSLKLFSLLTSLSLSFLYVISPAHSPKDAEDTGAAGEKSSPA